MKENFEEIFSSLINYFKSQKIEYIETDYSEKIYFIDNISDQNYIFEIIDCLLMKGFDKLKTIILDKKTYQLDSTEINKFQTVIFADLIKYIEEIEFKVSNTPLFKIGEIDASISSQSLNVDTINDELIGNLKLKSELFNKGLSQFFNLYRIRREVKSYKISSEVTPFQIEELYVKLTEGSNPIMLCTKDQFVDLLNGNGSLNDPIRIREYSFLRTLIKEFDERGLVAQKKEQNVYFADNFRDFNGKTTSSKYLRSNLASAKNYEIISIMNYVFGKSR